MIIYALASYFLQSLACFVPTSVCDLVSKIGDWVSLIVGISAMIMAVVTYIYGKTINRQTAEQLKNISSSIVEIKDFEIMIEIIERLGLKIIKDREKRRISFILKDVHFEIDKYPEIPAYLEIEAQNKGDIKKLVEELGYSMKDTTSKTATQVLKQYEVDNSNFLKFK